MPCTHAKRNLILQLLDFDSRVRIAGNGSGEAVFETRVRGSDTVLERDATGFVVHTLGGIARWVFGRLLSHGSDLGTEQYVIVLVDSYTWRAQAKQASSDLVTRTEEVGKSLLDLGVLLLPLRPSR
jgi:hypothetical protein